MCHTQARFIVRRRRWCEIVQRPGFGDVVGLVHQACRFVGIDIDRELIKPQRDPFGDGFDESFLAGPDGMEGSELLVSRQFHQGIKLGG